jgi:hypothetical protein
MQLKKESGISASLAAATCGLLGTLPPPVVAEESTLWHFDTALLYYREDDGRIRDTSVNAAVKRVLDAERSINLLLSVDSLTGASPNGAVPSSAVQTFTRPSGRASYQTAADRTPLIRLFDNHVRFAFTGSWSQTLGHARINAGLSGSTEYDYRHFGAHVRWERDFNQRNTTLFVSGAYGDDDVQPVGGAPVPLSVMRPVGDNGNKTGSESKRVLDGLIGVTQLLSRRALLSATYSYSHQDGYLTDRYKVLSVVDAAGNPIASGFPNLNLYRFDSRPDLRSRHSLFGEFRYALDRDSFAASARYLTDDWGIRSTTVDARYRWNLNSRQYLEPQVRYYQQSAADFYSLYLRDDQVLPRFASADYRLAEFDAFTAGFKYGLRTSHGEWSLRIEYYEQRPTLTDPAIGVLGSFNLTPNLRATIAQLSYEFKL